MLPSTDLLDATLLRLLHEGLALQHGGKRRAWHEAAAAAAARRSVERWRRRVPGYQPAAWGSGGAGKGVSAFNFCLASAYWVG